MFAELTAPIFIPANAAMWAASSQSLTSLATETEGRGSITDIAIDSAVHAAFRPASKKGGGWGGGHPQIKSTTAWSWLLIST